jgi:uncharacterized membrane protein
LLASLLAPLLACFLDSIARPPWLLTLFVFLAFFSSVFSVRFTCIFFFPFASRLPDLPVIFACPIGWPSLFAYFAF